MSIFTDQHLFIHIPKTAGASVITAIKSQKKITKVPNNKTTYNNYHSTAKDCVKYINHIDQLYKFSIVRHPWSRATSWFFFRKKIIEKNISDPKEKLIHNRILLHKELDIMAKGFNYWLKFYVNQPWDHTWFRLSDDQCTWLNGIELDLIIKYENLNHEIHKIPALHFNKLPSKHKSNNFNTDYRTLYTKDSIDIIENLYRRDIDKFGYSFE